MIQAIAVDDELPALQIIENFCHKTDLVNLQQTFNKPGEALEYVTESNIDLLFLDINMPSQNGIDLFTAMPKKVMVIFTTAYSKYAVTGFELNAIDYLMKPFTFERFLQAVEKAVERYKYTLGAKEEGEESIIIRADYSFLKINLADILYVESLGDYIKIHFQNQRPAITRITMKNVVDLLPKKQFIRIHRSYIVALSRVTKVRSKTVIVNRTELPLSSSYEEKFLASFINKNR